MISVGMSSHSLIQYLLVRLRMQKELKQIYLQNFCCFAGIFIYLPRYLGQETLK